MGPWEGPLNPTTTTSARAPAPPLAHCFQPRRRRRTPGRELDSEPEPQQGREPGRAAASQSRPRPRPPRGAQAAPPPCFPAGPEPEVREWGDPGGRSRRPGTPARRTKGAQRCQRPSSSEKHSGRKQRRRRGHCAEVRLAAKTGQLHRVLAKARPRESSRRLLVVVAGTLLGLQLPRCLEGGEAGRGLWPALRTRSKTFVSACFRLGDYISQQAPRAEARRWGRGSASLSRGPGRSRRAAAVAGGRCAAW